MFDFAIVSLAETKNPGLKMTQNVHRKSLFPSQFLRIITAVRRKKLLTFLITPLEEKEREGIPRKMRLPGAFLCLDFLEISNGHACRCSVCPLLCEPVFS